jgi:S-DNA-T family DNA segregation ATPase FtsK/SpoIIIE
MTGGSQHRNVPPSATGGGSAVGPNSEANSDEARGKELVPRTSGVPARRPPAGRITPRPARRIVVDAVAVVRRATSGGRPADVVRWMVRNGIIYIATGGYVATRRWWEARTNARYERLMRSAEAAGDYERLTDWEQRAEQARERRHRRRMDWITAPLDLARATAVAILSVIAFLLGLGGVLALAHADSAWLLAPVQKTVDGVAWLVWLLDKVWIPATVALP